MDELTTRRRVRGRPRADDDTALTRDAILSRALTHFAVAGYHGFSLRELARELGVSHGLLNIRFGTKDELWRAAVEWGLAHVADRLNQTHRDGSLEDRFREAVIAILMAIDAVPSLLQLVNQEAAVPSERLTFLTETIIKARYSVLEDIVREGIACGRFCEVPPHLVFILVAHGGGAMFALKPLSLRLGLLEADTGQAVRARAEQVAEFVLRGLLQR